MKALHKHFLVNPTDLFQTRVETFSMSELEEGEILFRITSFAFTSNNITYGVVGDRFGYWQFFPAPESWGIIPAWGFAEVVESKVDAVKAGEKCYGYFPMGTSLKIKPTKISSVGFFDGSTHRKELSPIYNYYQIVSSTSGFSTKWADYIPIIRPLFATSFLNYHFLVDNDFFQGKNLILTSASSKTALGIAFMMQQNQRENPLKIIGLTSPGNVEFVEQTGFYDSVIAYDQVQNELPYDDSLVVDLAGNGILLRLIEEALGEKLLYISKIGLADWQTGNQDFKHPNAHLFFAPSQGQKLYKAWGEKVANARIAEGMNLFIEQAKDWINVHYINDFEGLEELYTQMLEGKVDPSKGYIVKID